MVRLQSAATATEGQFESLEAAKGAMERSPFDAVVWESFLSASPTSKAFIDFVDLYLEKHEAGLHPRVSVSA